jgi:hypothetical protein
MKDMSRSGRCWLWVAPVLLCLFDHALTLYGQPSAYLAGDHTRACDGNPIVQWCLEQHPAAFAAETILWIALFGWLIVVLPWPLAKTVSLAVSLGHVVGSTSWIWSWLENYWLFPPLLLSSAGLIVWTWEQAARRMSGEGPSNQLPQHPGLPTGAQSEESPRRESVPPGTLARAVPPGRR